MRIKILFLLIGLVLILSSCMRSFSPEIEKYEEILVVDGVITNQPGPYTVRLSKSTKIQERPKNVPYSKCKVTIVDNLGNETPLAELAPGVYQTDPFAMQGIVGRKYHVVVSTPDDEIYESVEEELLKPIEIQALYAELEHRDDPDLFYGRDGYQFYLDAETPVGHNNFLLWNLQSTYKFKTDLEIHSYYMNGKRHLVDDGDTLRFCYRTVDILDLFLYSSSQSSHLPIKRMALNYEDNYTKALSIRYSLRVQQFTISESAFNYWNTIKKIRDEQGELYTQQPYQVKNNLRNRTHSEKPVLGYFMVSGLSEKRIFVSAPPVEGRYDQCKLSGAPVKHLDNKLKLRPDLWPFFLVDPAQFNGDYWVDQSCLDCRKTGVLERPSFWVD